MARWAGVAGSKGSGRRPEGLYRRQRGGRLSRNIPCRAGNLARATVCNDDGAAALCQIEGEALDRRPAGHPIHRTGAGARVAPARPIAS